VGSYAVTLRVNTTGYPANTIVNSATVSTVTYDPDLSNNSDDEVTTVESPNYTITGWNGFPYGHAKISPELLSSPIIGPRSNLEQDFLSHQRWNYHLQLWGAYAIGFEFTDLPILCLTEIMPGNSCPEGEAVKPDVTQVISYTISSIAQASDSEPRPLQITTADGQPFQGYTVFHIRPHLFNQPGLNGYEWQDPAEYVHIIWLGATGRAPTIRP
jgi:hypothetical protein